MSWWFFCRTCFLTLKLFCNDQFFSLPQAKTALLKKAKRLQIADMDAQLDTMLVNIGQLYTELKGTAGEKIETLYPRIGYANSVCKTSHRVVTITALVSQLAATMTDATDSEIGFILEISSDLPLAVFKQAEEQRQKYAEEKRQKAKADPKAKRQRR